MTFHLLVKTFRAKSLVIGSENEKLIILSNEYDILIPVATKT